MNDSLPVVALVGAPNVGKSTLLNKIAGEHLAVTSPVPGTTRDRQYAEIHWNEKDFLLLDTAGLDLASKSDLESSIQEQIQIAIKEASVIVLVADYKVGSQALDRKVLLALRKNTIPKILAVNKVDSPRVFGTATIEYAKWGIKPAIPVSAVSGRGIGDLLDEITLLLPKTQISRTPDTSIKIALIGKPNVGKSSIFNYWVGSKRVVVSEVPGTTRTAIDTKITQDHQDFTLIDTAGLRRKSLRQAQPDVFSGFQTYRSIRKSDVSLLILDSTTEITKQDQSLAREIFDQQKGCIILANKTDLTGDVKSQMHAYISSNFPFLWMCPVFFVSAKNGLGLADVLPAAIKIFEDRNKTIPQAQLDKLLATKMEVDPPRRLKDQKAPKVLGLQQIGTNPPIFELLVNHPPAINDSFRKSIIKTIIKELDIWGTPIKVLTVKKVGETKHEIERS